MSDRGVATDSERESAGDAGWTKRELVAGQTHSDAVRASSDSLLRGDPTELEPKSRPKSEPKLEAIPNTKSEAAATGHRLIDVSRSDPREIDVIDAGRMDANFDANAIDANDEELAAFLAADYETVEADPEFKRKLRDQLWTLVQGREMTRQ